MVAAMLIMLVYPLTEKALSKVVADLNERRESPAP
jgi:Na+/melibiose symporter-like transporter